MEFTLPLLLAWEHAKTILSQSTQVDRVVKLALRMATGAKDGILLESELLRTAKLSPSNQISLTRIEARSVALLITNIATEFITSGCPSQDTFLKRLRKSLQRGKTTLDDSDEQLVQGIAEAAASLGLEDGAALATTAEHRFGGSLVQDCRLCQESSDGSTVNTVTLVTCSDLCRGLQHNYGGRLEIVL